MQRGIATHTGSDVGYLKMLRRRSCRGDVIAVLGLHIFMSLEAQDCCQRVDVCTRYPVRTGCSEHSTGSHVDTRVQVDTGKKVCAS